MRRFFASVLTAMVVGAFANRLGMNYGAIMMMTLFATFLAIGAARKPDTDND